MNDHAQNAKVGFSFDQVAYWEMQKFTRNAIMRKCGIGRNVFERLHERGFIRCYKGAFWVDVTEDELQLQIALLLLENA